MSRKQEVYVSVDIETDGPIPGPYSMLSLGAAAFVEGGRTPVATFEVNLARLEGAGQDPDTMAWWAKQDPTVWAHVTKDPKPPEEAMRHLGQWVKTLPGDPVLVTYPAWDYAWVHWYTVRFLGKNPFGLAGLDVKSYAFALLDPGSFKGTAKKNFDPALFAGAPPHTHQALDDAIGQGVMFVNMLSRRRSA